jgi:nicotinamide mononucleotide adenylyltransferase
VLASHWVDKIAIVWTTADVRETVSQALSDAEAAEVLQKVLRDADADDGVTWDSLQDAANE